MRPGREMRPAPKAAPQADRRRTTDDRHSSVHPTPCGADPRWQAAVSRSGAVHASLARRHAARRAARSARRPARGALPWTTGTSYRRAGGTLLRSRRFGRIPPPPLTRGRLKTADGGATSPPRRDSDTGKPVRRASCACNEGNSRASGGDRGVRAWQAYPETGAPQPRVAAPRGEVAIRWTGRLTPGSTPVPTLPGETSPAKVTPRTMSDPRRLFQ